MKLLAFSLITVLLSSTSSRSDDEIFIGWYPEKVVVEWVGCAPQYSVATQYFADEIQDKTLFKWYPKDELGPRVRFKMPSGTYSIQIERINRDPEKAVHQFFRFVKALQYNTGDK